MKCKRLKSFNIAVLVLILAGGTYLITTKKNRASQKVLSVMTPEESYYLSSFLNTICLFDNFYYVLFGNKPIAFANYSYSTPFNIRFQGMTMSHLKFRKGFEVLRKYKSYFSDHNILVQFVDDDEGSAIVMINKKNLLKTFNENKSDFEQILGPGLTSEDFWAQIAKGKNIWEATQGHQALLGILLGYGRGNAWLFHNRRMMEDKLYESDSPIKRTDLIEEEISKLDQQLQAFNTCSIDRKSCLKKPFISLPDFAADPNSPETQELREQYGKDREKIIKIISGKNLLEATLEQLMDR